MGRMVIKPMMNDRWVRLAASAQRLRMSLAITARTTPTTNEATTSRLPSSEVGWELDLLRSGSKMAMSVPTRAMAIPVCSRRVTCSLNQTTPTAATMMG